jgi:multiple sugar transport system substrate-binding protein
MARMRKKLGAVLVGAAALSLTLTACGGGGGGAEGGGADAGGGAIDTSQAAGDVSYWLWDANQQPAYQQCADKFKQANPNINVKITQYGWDDYWSKLTNGFVAGDAPDVFTDHLAKYPEFVSQEQLVPLDDTLSKDGFNVNQYQEGLADLWKGPDGKRYGLPKDFDTIAIFYNKKLIADAGVKEADLQNLQWNPQDGGTYETMITHLTVDQSGSGSGVGQTQWSMYTGSNNWQFTDKNPWGTHYNYDQPAFQDSIKWLASLIEKGYMPSVAAVTGQGSSDIYAAGKYAMITNGSWMINSMFGAKGIETGVAPLPVGPSGKRASMYNGLADSIWVGSKNKPAAAKWVEFLGSPDCQNIVGEKAVVFPAIPQATDKAEAAFKAKGVDVSAFLINVKEKTTFLFPITDHASQIEGIMHPAMDDVLSGKAPVTSLTDANNQVNQLFG